MTLFNNFCAAILAVASACRTAINDAARIIFGFFAAGTNAAVEFLPTIRRMKSATAFLAVAVAIPLMSACGGGGSGGTDLNSSRGLGTAEEVSDVGTILETTVMSVVASTTTIPQPMASTVAAIAVDFTTGTGSDLVFPVDDDGSALIRSANGNDYAYINHQDSFTIATTTTIAAVLPSFDLADASSFTYQVSSGGCTGGDGVPSSLASCEPDADDSNMGTWTFTGPGSIPATTTFGGVAFSAFVDSLTPTPTPETIDPVLAMDAMTMTMRETFSPIHVWEFETGQTNSEVASVVAAFQTKVTAAVDLARANVTVTVKGARDRVNLSRPSDNQNIRYSVDAYIFETEYSALGLWIEDPREFFGLSTVAWDPAVSDSGVFYFGLQTPTVGVPNTRTARYTGIAAGRYFRNLGVSATNRFSVSGVVTLNADFASNGIDGTAALTAYEVADLATSSGVVTVQLTGGTFGTDDESATFSGDTSISGTAGAFRALERGVGAFRGYFTGPEAEEAVGRATVVTDDDFLEFGFLTRQVPSSGGN